MQSRRLFFTITVLASERDARCTEKERRCQGNRFLRRRPLSNSSPSVSRRLLTSYLCTYDSSSHLYLGSTHPGQPRHSAVATTLPTPPNLPLATPRQSPPPGCSPAPPLRPTPSAQRNNLSSRLPTPLEPLPPPPPYFDHLFPSR